MNKMVINHLEKLFVTNDAATIIRELEVEHPAAKMMILGSQMMEQEVHKLDIFDKTRQFWTNIFAFGQWNQNIFYYKIPYGTVKFSSHFKQFTATIDSK